MIVRFDSEKQAEKDRIKEEKYLEKKAKRAAMLNGDNTAYDKQLAEQRKREDEEKAKIAAQNGDKYRQ